MLNLTAEQKKEQKKMGYTIVTDKHGNRFICLAPILGQKGYKAVQKLEEKTDAEIFETLMSSCSFEDFDDDGVFIYLNPSLPDKEIRNDAEYLVFFYKCAIRDARGMTGRRNRNLPEKLRLSTKNPHARNKSFYLSEQGIIESLPRQLRYSCNYYTIIEHPHHFDIVYDIEILRDVERALSSDIYRLFNALWSGEDVDYRKATYIKKTNYEDEIENVKEYADKAIKEMKRAISEPKVFLETNKDLIEGNIHV